MLAQTAFHRVFQLLAQMAHACFHRQSGYTLGPAQRIAHSGSHGETRGVSDGGRYYYPRSVPHVHQHPRAGYQNGVLCRLGILAGRCSRRTQRAFGTAMRLCASLFRGVAAPLGCVICLQLGDVAVFFTLCAVLSERARWGWYHYPRRALRAAETPGPRLLKRLTCRFYWLKIIF